MTQKGVSGYLLVKGCFSTGISSYEKQSSLMSTKLIGRNTKVGGGAKVILNTKFDDWWNERWITLFGYEGTRNGAFIDGQKPRYYLSTNRPKANGIRYALMVYQNRHRGGTLEIAEWIKSYEHKKSQLRSGVFWVEETFELQSRIGRYRKNAHETLENVSVGVFP
jgi:hypothetical protein